MGASTRSGQVQQQGAGSAPPGNFGGLGGGIVGPLGGAAGFSIEDLFRLIGALNMGSFMGQPQGSPTDMGMAMGGALPSFLGQGMTSMPATPPSLVQQGSPMGLSPLVNLGPSITGLFGRGF